MSVGGAGVESGPPGAEADGAGPAGGSSAGGSSAGGSSAERSRMLAARHGAERVLAGGSPGRTLREQLARLVADAPAAYDLADWTDIYGNDDGVVGELERRTADVLGTEAAAFFPTGTMAQQVALRCWAGRTGSTTVAGHPLSHMEVHERDAYAVVSGLRMVHPTSEPRLPTAAEISGLQEPFGTLALELPLRDAGFVLPEWAELTAAVEAARERDAVVHFDGARLWECTSHFGRPLPEIAALADSVYVSYYKSLDGISGAALAGSEDFVEEARAWRHRYGGQLFQQWPAALAALAGLERELPRLPEYVARAKAVARILGDGLAEAGVPWFRVHPRVPHTHQFQLWLPHPAAELNEAGIRQAEETRTALFRTWSEPGLAGLAMTEVTIDSSATEWTPEDLRTALADFLRRLGR
ncbi:threonine aldolase family protein [Streptomyces celluloflavus]|uniref:threonine aldolase family protein n=1 Tax=Streptomyces celluloflavus TaxID=58344 RepID=UPI00345F820E|nr:beta-eliminating lyase-related protein [Streptomyces celluloflavus]